MNKHTKGPWCIITPEEKGKTFGDEDTSVFGFTIISEKDDGCPWIIADVAEGQPGEGLPDASLLAAAPDLLEALEMLLNAVKQEPIMNNCKYDAIGKKVLDAISKAKGES